MKVSEYGIIRETGIGKGPHLVSLFLQGFRLLNAPHQVQVR